MTSLPPEEEYQWNPLLHDWRYINFQAAHFAYFGQSKIDSHFANFGQVKIDPTFGQVTAILLSLGKTLGHKKQSKSSV